MRKKVIIIAYEIGEREEGNVWISLTEGRAIVQKDFEGHEQAQAFMSENPEQFPHGYFYQIIEVYID